MKEIKELGNDPDKIAELDPAAYEALPSSYKNDHCLTFFYDINGNLCAEHDLGGKFMFKVNENSGKSEWVEI